MGDADDAWAERMEEPGSFVPRIGSAAYAERAYWDWRFSHEDTKEWLASYADVRDLVRAHVPCSARVLVVGNGNSQLPMELADDGYGDVTASDYSDVVVRAMQSRAAASHPAIAWRVADMTRLCESFPDRSFDAVVDKAGLDAILADGGDVWDPPEALLEAARACTLGVARLLRPGGVFLSLSFAQPHFRRAYLQAPPPLTAVVEIEAADGVGPPPPGGATGSRLELSYVHKVNVGLGYHLYCLHVGLACPDRR